MILVKSSYLQKPWYRTFISYVGFVMISFFPEVEPINMLWQAIIYKFLPCCLGCSIISSCYKHQVMWIQNFICSPQCRCHHEMNILNTLCVNWNIRIRVDCKLQYCRLYEELGKHLRITAVPVIDELF